MNKFFNNNYTSIGTSSYNDSFWKGLHGDDKAFGDLIDGKHSLTNTYLLPESTGNKYSAALKAHNLFRRIGTVMNATKNDHTIRLSDAEDLPVWVPEGGSTPTAVDSFPDKAVATHKLAIITAIENDFISDKSFDLETYLVGQFSKRFGRAEENAFINGTGVNMPKGILSDAETGINVTGDITFDDVLALYFSVDKQYRSGGAWLMNDETALKLKTLKDQNGQYLWNQNSDTVLGKPVHISEFMPSDGKPIAFGDFSYYTIIDRVPLTVRTLYEKFALEQKIGYLGVEHLDGLLIRPEAVKVLAVTA
ncbi:MAG: phage major capsid protein [Clostridia bacterium]|nr:phage major capsid protein [Clostridia bacterium]